MLKRTFLPQNESECRSLVPLPRTHTGLPAIIDNAEPSSCAVCVLDVSASMAVRQRYGIRPIDRLNEGLRVLTTKIHDDEIMSRYCELAIIRCAGEPTLVHDFAPIGQFNPPVFQPDGNTPLAESLLFAVDLIEEWQRNKKSLDCDVCKPFVLTITDGCPTDSDKTITRAAARIRQLEREKRIAFFAATTGNDEDVAALRVLFKRPPRPLADFNYPAVFRWFAEAARSMSRSNPGEAYPVPDPEESGWKTI